MSEVFKKLSSNLANNLVQKHPTAAKKFGNKSVEDYYNDMFNLNPNKLTFKTIPNQIHLISYKKLRHKQSCRNS